MTRVQLTPHECLRLHHLKHHIRRAVNGSSTPVDWRFRSDVNGTSVRGFIAFWPRNRQLWRRRQEPSAMNLDQSVQQFWCTLKTDLLVLFMDKQINRKIKKSWESHTLDQHRCSVWNSSQSLQLFCTNLKNWIFFFFYRPWKS